MEAARDPTKSMLHRGDAVWDSLDVVNWKAEFCVIFKQQSVRKRRLRPLDLGRQERFFPEI